MRALFVRDTEEKMNEIYPKLMAPDTEWQVLENIIAQVVLLSWR